MKCNICNTKVATPLAQQRTDSGGAHGLTQSQTGGSLERRKCSVGRRSLVAVGGTEAEGALLTSTRRGSLVNLSSSTTAAGGVVLTSEEENCVLRPPSTVEEANKLFPVSSDENFLRPEKPRPSFSGATAALTHAKVGPFGTASLPILINLNLKLVVENFLKFK